MPPNGHINGGHKTDFLKLKCPFEGIKPIKEGFQTILQINMVEIIPKEKFQILKHCILSYKNKKDEK